MRNGGRQRPGGVGQRADPQRQGVLGLDQAPRGYRASSPWRPIGPLAAATCRPLPRARCGVPTRPARSHRAVRLARREAGTAAARWRTSQYASIVAPVVAAAVAQQAIGKADRLSRVFRQRTIPIKRDGQLLGAGGRHCGNQSRSKAAAAAAEPPRSPMAAGRPNRLCALPVVDVGVRTATAANRPARPAFRERAGRIGLRRPSTEARSCRPASARRACGRRCRLARLPTVARRRRTSVHRPRLRRTGSSARGSSGRRRRLVALRPAARPVEPDGRPPSPADR